MELTAQLSNIINSAVDMAAERNDRYVTVEHLLYSLTFDDSFADNFAYLDGDIDALRDDLYNFLN